eukprot:CAMPEP_0175446846 /NCGR_PEP_ID=MMETSP0095-20121207/60496_1 /TAXON_ID=311494 /ORGANISM="Alexandrium monilatum, Strain CCMP3105" /LENGTH=40 /DNA_ID= /DNA_START= /DNA_END= /DNA_ORIENTATION=
MTWSDRTLLRGLATLARLRAFAPPGGRARGEPWDGMRASM